MQTHEYFHRGKVVLPMADGAIGTYLNAPHTSAFGAVLPPGARQITPFERFNMHPSEVCPENFIVFDQTNQQNRVLFNPAMTYKFNSPGFNFNTHAYTQDFEKDKINQMERELSSSFEEDSKDIDALMSLDSDELEDYDEEEVSTARTHHEESTSDTCSSYCTKSRKKRLLSSSVQNSSGTKGYCSSSEKKQHREMKRMVKILRNIVPGGGNEMDTVTVLDEAVKYLKSLKVEVEQFGVGQ